MNPSDRVLPLPMSREGASRRLWITWENQRRNHSLSRAVDAELVQLDTRANRWLRYPLLAVRTLIELIRRRPGLLFVQNPSLILSVLAVTWGRLRRTPVIVDAHNAGVQPFDGRRCWANRLAGYALRHADLTIVSNRGLRSSVIDRGGRPIVLPDPIPTLDRPPSIEQQRDGFSILFVCTWASDEPYLEVLRAACALDASIRIYITGNSKGRERAFGGRLPENVVLTGFVSEQRFVELLFACDAVMDLTTRENCLVCGAYEATAAERPMILSATECLRKYFSSGAVYTDNTAGGIAVAVTELTGRYEALCREIKQLKAERSAQWLYNLGELEEALAGLERRASP